MLIIDIIDKFIEKDNLLDYFDLIFLKNNDETDILFFKNSIIDNEFIEKKYINLYIDIYIKAKRIKNIFIKFSKIYKWKKAVKYNSNTDLYLNNLSIFKEKFKISILENKTIYHFRLSDLVNYWVECLTNHEGLFSKPVRVKNPHTNLIISTHNLYNIYFKLLDTGFIIPMYISAFFYSNMNINVFLYKYYTMLKELTIMKFNNSNAIYDKWEQVLNMLHEHRKEIDYITFDNDIEYKIKKEICSKLKKILLMYLKSKYSCNPRIKKDSSKKNIELLKKYLEHNPNFGFSSNENIIIRYVPYSDVNRRRRRRGAYPNPSFTDYSNNLVSFNLTPNPPDQPPPPPPIELSSIPLQSVITSNTTSDTTTSDTTINPFVPTRQLSRTPTNNHTRTTISGSLSLFG